ncbi:MAG: hypothetical protein GY906_07445, partial [bacterium]|nr:hypothetical protein [bacterium]
MGDAQSVLVESGRGGGPPTPFDEKSSDGHGKSAGPTLPTLAPSASRGQVLSTDASRADARRSLADVRASRAEAAERARAAVQSAPQDELERVTVLGKLVSPGLLPEVIIDSGFVQCKVDPLEAVVKKLQELPVSSISVGLPPIIDVVASQMGTDDGPATGPVSKNCTAWREYLFRIAIAVMIVFDVRNLKKFLRAFFEKSGDTLAPVLSRWPFVLEYISLTAAKHHFLDKITSPSEFRKKCSGTGTETVMPPPNDSKAPAFHLWSDSTLSLKYLKNGGAAKPKYGAFTVSKAISECCGLAASTAEAVTSGGTVVELLAFLRRLVDAQQMAKEIANPEE